MFGLNNAQLIGRLGADATISHLTNGGRVANVSIATDESYLDKNSGDKVDRTEWHRIVTFQDGLVEMLEKHAKKGRLVFVSGKLQTRKWRKDGEDSDRFSTEILLVPGGRVQFLDKPNGNGAPAKNGDTMPSAETSRRWMTARFRSSGLPPSRITLGQSPPSWRGAGPSFLESRSSLPPQSSQTVDAERPRCALRSRGPHRQEFEAGLKGGVPQKAPEVPHETISRHRSAKESRPMNATEIAAALSTRAEDVCRRYLPRGRRQGRYWTIGDTSGAKGRSLFVRLAPPGIPGKWTDAATNEHGDLLDLIRLHTGGASLWHAMEEALAFLSLRQSTPANGGNRAGGYDREEAARRLWRRCRPIDGTHAEAYLHARAIGLCRFPALRFHPDLIHRGDDGIHRLPALVAAVTGDDGAIEGVQRTWLDPKLPEKANLVHPRKALGRVHGRAVRFCGTASGATLLAGEGIETVLSVVTAVPGIHAAAALSAGSLGAFEPPQDLALLVIARDKDVEGGHAANRLQHRCVERGIPSIVIVPEHSDFNDDLVAVGADTLAARLSPLIASTQPAATGEERGGSGRIITPS